MADSVLQPAQDMALTRDVFLNGKFHLWQPRDGYRAATDPVLLAAAVPARPGQSVLELGCGAGAALLALASRVPDLALNGIERQEAYAELARRNLAENGRDGQIVTGDLAAMPPPLRVAFDHVLANPPYYRPTDPAARDSGRAQALREETPLANWIDAALRRCKPGGTITVIHLIDRLPHLLTLAHDRGSALSVRPITARAPRAAGRVLLQIRKGSRAPFALLPPLVMHEGDAHLRDGDDFSPLARAVLRDGAAIDWA